MAVSDAFPEGGAVARVSPLSAAGGLSDAVVAHGLRKMTRVSLRALSKIARPGQNEIQGGGYPFTPHGCTPD